MTNNSQKIIPHLWFDKEAHDAAKFYTTVFPESKITNIRELKDTPGGGSEIISFQLWRRPFMAISAGPYFQINPSISFMVNFDSSRLERAAEQLEEVWHRLAEGGRVLMPLDSYPFSRRYGWVEDKYGLSWQLILTNPEGEERPEIIPSFLFTGEVHGKAEEAIDFYVSVFKNAKKGHIARYPKGMEPDQEGSVMFADFMIENQWFAAMDSGRNHDFHFNEAVSFIVNCGTQEEIDYYWKKLSAVPESEQCGWLKDKFRVSWQIVPAELEEMMAACTAEQAKRLNEAIFKMKKLDLPVLRKAYEG